MKIDIHLNIKDVDNEVNVQKQLIFSCTPDKYPDSSGGIAKIGCLLSFIIGMCGAVGTWLQSPVPQRGQFNESAREIG